MVSGGNLEDQNVSFILKTMLAGGIAGSIAKTAVAPLDRVKIHFQVRNPDFSPFIGRMMGVFDALKSTYKTQGFVGLFRGHSATLARVFPYAGINFMVYEQAKIRLGISSHKYSPAWKRIIAGSIAGCTAVTFTYPFDLLRARIAFVASSETSFQKGVYRSTVKTILKEGRSAFGWSILGFYQGYLPTMIGIVPYAGTSFFTFESLKNWYYRHYDTTTIPQGIRLSFGMAAGVCAQTITYPLDVIRRRSQLWRSTPHLPPSDTSRFFDTPRLMRDLVRSGGVRELFVGLSINYLKVAPSMGISFVVYDYLKARMNI